MAHHAAILGPCLAFAACAAAPRPLAEPPIELRVAHGLAANDAAGLSPDGARRSLRIELFALRRAPSGRSLDDATLAIVAQHGAPFRGVANLVPGCLWLDGDAAAAATGPPDAAQRLGAADAALVDGLEVTIAPSLASLPWLRFALRNGACRLTIDTPAVIDQPADHVLLRDPLAAAHALFVPAPSATIAGYAFTIGVSDAVDRAAAAAAIAAARDGSAATTAGPLERQARIAAAALGEHNRRPALLALARQYGSPRCADAILAADEAHLAAMTMAACADAPAADGREWAFERGVWSAMVPAMQRDDLPPGLFACLLRHFGVLALDATALQLRLEAAADAVAFDAAVREENEQALESRDPVRRVRGHEWLSCRAAAVPGYDPSADLESRRRALRRHATEALRR